MFDVDVPKGMKIGSSFDKVAVVQHMIRSTKIDHKKFNLFLDSKFGKNLLKGLLDVITGGGVSTVA